MKIDRALVDRADPDEFGFIDHAAFDPDARLCPEPGMAM